MAVAIRELAACGCDLAVTSLAIPCEDDAILDLRVHRTTNSGSAQNDHDTDDESPRDESHDSPFVRALGT
jgi:hypothetical protein